MKNAIQRRVWWPLKLVQFDETGTEVSGNAVALVTVLTPQERQRITDLGMQSLRDSIAAQQMRNKPEIGMAPEHIAARNAEIAALEKSALDAGNEVIDALRSNVHDWRKFQSDGVDVPYSADVLAELLVYEDFQKACSTTLREAATGARTKN